MKKIIAVTLLIAFGCAQAMAPVSHGAGKNASATTARRALSDDAMRSVIDDDDEAAPPVHIFHASSKKPAHKSGGKKPQATINTRTGKPRSAN